MTTPIYEVRCIKCGRRIPNCETIEDFITVSEGHRRAYHGTRMERRTTPRVELEVLWPADVYEMRHAEREHYEGHASPHGDDASAMSDCRGDVCIRAVRRWALLALLTAGPRHESMVNGE